MSLRGLWIFLPLFALAALLLGCPPQIGKDCTLSTDCSQLGDRLCDTSQPDGYCTVFNCEPDSCPNAICVAFQGSLDPACGSANDGQWPRLQRTFCLSQCSSPGVPGDCRSDGYECVDLSIPANQISREAQVIDTGANDGGLGYMVCMVNAPVPSAGIATCGCGRPCPSGQQCSAGYCYTPCAEDSDCKGVDKGADYCDHSTTASTPAGLCMDGGGPGMCSFAVDAGPDQCKGSCVPAVCNPPDAGFPTDGAAPWTPYTPDAGP